MNQTLPGVMLNLKSHFGVLLQGDSGVGKSELALSLLDRGHQLVSDDLVTMHCDHNSLIASAPPASRGFLGLRDIGIIIITDHFGPDSLCDHQKIGLVITLTLTEFPANPLPLCWPRTEILGCAIPSLQLYAHSSRPLALLVETAAQHLQSHPFPTQTFLQSCDIARALS